MAMNSDVWIWENLCTVPSNCNIIYSREYTPLLMALSPVTYYGAEFGFVVDPKNSLAYRILDKDLPFKEARIDGKVLDFEGKVDESTPLYYGYTNYITGITG
jgi:hypothetical protein